MITRFVAALSALVPLTLAAQIDSDSTVSKQKPIAVLEKHHAAVTSVKFSPDGKLLATADLDGRVILWRADAWTLLRTLNHGAEVHSIAFSPDGRLIASSGSDNKIILWNPNTGQRLRSIANNHRVMTVIFAPDGQLVAGGEEGIVHFFDSSTGKEIRTLKADGPVWSVTVSGDGSTIATSLPIRVWDYRTLSKKLSVRGFGQLGVALSRDAKRLVSAEATGGALLWKLGDSATYTPLRTPVERKALGAKGYESFEVNMPVASIDFSANGDRAVGGGTTGLVYVWDHLDMQPPVPLKLGGHTMTVSAVALSPNGEFAASGSLDRTVRIWKLDPIRR